MVERNVGALVQRRPAREVDREFFYELNRATMRDYVVATWGAWDEDFQHRYFDEHFASGSTDILENDGQPVGILRIEQHETAIFLAEIQILPAHQGRGIGARLMKQAIAHAEAASLPLALQVLKVNVRARALYERLGLHVTGETDTHHLMSTYRRPRMRDLPCISLGS